MQDQNPDLVRIQAELKQQYAGFIGASSDSPTSRDFKSKLESSLEALNPGARAQIFRHGESLLSVLRNNEETYFQYRPIGKELGYLPTALVDIQTAERLTQFNYKEISEYNSNGLIRAQKVFPPRKRIPEIREFTRSQGFNPDDFQEHFGYEYIDARGKVVVPATYDSDLPEFYDGTDLILKTFNSRNGFALFNKKGQQVSEWGFDYPSQGTSDTCEVLGNLAKLDAVTRQKGRNLTRELFLVDSNGKNILGDLKLDVVESLAVENVPAPDFGVASGKAPSSFRKTSKVLVGSEGKFGVVNTENGEILVPIEYDREEAVEKIKKE